jgi:hypothetical protein
LFDLVEILGRGRFFFFLGLGQEPQDCHAATIAPSQNAPDSFKRQILSVLIFDRSGAIIEVMVAFVMQDFNLAFQNACFGLYSFVDHQR